MDYSKLRKKVEGLVDRFGFEAVLLKPGEPTGDPWNPGPPGPPTEHPIQIVQDFERLRDMNGTLIGVTQMTLLISTAGGVVPAREDAVRLNGSEYPVAAVRPVSPGGQALLYEVDLEGPG